MSAAALEPGSDAEAMEFWNRASVVLAGMGVPLDCIEGRHDLAHDALLTWLDTGRKGGASWSAARFRVRDALERVFRRRRARPLRRIQPRPQPLCGAASGVDLMDRLLVPGDTPEDWMNAAETIDRRQNPPEPIAQLRELFHTESAWTDAVEARAAAMLREAYEAGRREGATIADAGPVIDRVRAWLRKHPGRKATHTEIAAECVTTRESVSRAMAEIRREG